VELQFNGGSLGEICLKRILMEKIMKKETKMQTKAEVVLSSS
jgi:hypothetical protein